MRKKWEEKGVMGYLGLVKEMDGVKDLKSFKEPILTSLNAESLIQKVRTKDNKSSIFSLFSSP